MIPHFKKEMVPVIDNHAAQAYRNIQCLGQLRCKSFCRFAFNLYSKKLVADPF